MQDISYYLLALGNPDPAVRIPAEQEMTSAAERDFSSYILSLLSIFRVDTPSVAADPNSPFIRQMAGTLLKNSVAPSLRDLSARQILSRRWRALPKELRENVKQNVLATLGSSEKSVRLVAANIVGSLARIELPEGEWPELLTILLQAVNAPETRHQEAALTALGYVCEEGKEEDTVGDVLEPRSGDILDAIVKGMGSQDHDVQFCATNALCNAMEFIKGNMEQPEQRNYLVGGLCTTIQVCQEERTREKAMECLVKVAELYYFTLPDYINQLFSITMSILAKDTEAVKLQAMQLWISICETESLMMEDGDFANCHKYAAGGKGELSKICLDCLIQQVEGQTENDWNLSTAGGKLLQCLAEVVKDDIVALVMPFVFSNIESADWHMREAALMAFGCILVGPSEDKLGDTVAQAVPGLLQYIRDGNLLVADTAAWVLAIICESYCNVFLEVSNNLRQLLDNVVSLITQNLTNNPEMACRSVHIVLNLALALEEEESEQPSNSNQLSEYFSDLVTILFQAIDRGGSHELKSIAQEALNALMDAAANDCIPLLEQIAPELHKRMRNQLDILIPYYSSRQNNMNGLQTASSGSSSSSVMESETMLGLLCGALDSLARKLKERFVPFLDHSMALLNDIFNLSNDSTLGKEALVALGSFAYVSGPALAHFLPTIMPFIMRCLKNVDDEDIVFGSVAAVGDLCQLGKMIEPYVKEIMTILFDGMQNTNVDRELKCSYLGCFGDIILRVLGSEGFIPYMPTLLPSVHQIFTASCQLDYTHDAETENYVMTLWFNIAAFYSNVVQSFKHTNIQFLLPYLENMLQLALHACSKATDYDDTFYNAFSLIGDLASILKNASAEARQRGKNALLVPAVLDFVKRANSRKPPEDMVQQVRWVRDQLNALDKC